jgi:hypothetical protein
MVGTGVGVLVGADVGDAVGAVGVAVGTDVYGTGSAKPGIMWVWCIIRAFRGLATPKRSKRLTVGALVGAGVYFCPEK